MHGMCWITGSVAAGVAVGKGWRAAMALVLGAAVLTSPVPSRAGDPSCEVPVPARSDRLVQSYAPTLELCGHGDARRIAIRSMRLDGQPAYLLVDPERLTTSLESAACWSCTPASDEDIAQTRYETVVRHARDQEGKVLGEARLNAGMTGMTGQGTAVTLDLCPSRKPLDRWILSDIAARQQAAPVALSVTGAWMRRHGPDMNWLREQARAGALAITWVNHTDLHRFVAGLRPDHNLMLLPGTNPESEILGAERQLIAEGETPSVFFRFPGLVSTPALSEAVARHHLVAIGASAWLALGQKPRPGSVILAHANGNEPQGLSALARQLEGNPEVLPLRPLTDLR
jgi:hypothetical protein